MNIITSSIVATLALGLFVAPVRAAEVTAKISNVHLCCKSCVTGVEKVAAKVEGLIATVDKDARTVTLAGPDTATVQKGADALVAKLGRPSGALFWGLRPFPEQLWAAMAAEHSSRSRRLAD